MLEKSTGRAKRFSCLYSPGATEGPGLVQQHRHAHEDGRIDRQLERRQERRGHFGGDHGALARQMRQQRRGDQGVEVVGEVVDRQKQQAHGGQAAQQALTQFHHMGHERHLCAIDQLIVVLAVASLAAALDAGAASFGGGLLFEDSLREGSPGGAASPPEDAGPSSAIFGIGAGGRGDAVIGQLTTRRRGGAASPPCSKAKRRLSASSMCGQSASGFRVSGCCFTPD